MANASTFFSTFSHFCNFKSQTHIQKQKKSDDDEELNGFLEEISSHNFFLSPLEYVF